MYVCLTSSFAENRPKPEYTSTQTDELDSVKANMFTANDDRFFFFPLVATTKPFMLSSFNFHSNSKLSLTISSTK